MKRSKSAIESRAEHVAPKIMIEAQSLRSEETLRSYTGTRRSRLSNRLACSEKSDSATPPQTGAALSDMKQPFTRGDDEMKTATIEVGTKVTIRRGRGVAGLSGRVKQVLTHGCYLIEMTAPGYADRTVTRKEISIDSAK